MMTTYFYQSNLLNYEVNGNTHPHWSDCFNISKVHVSVKHVKCSNSKKNYICEKQFLCYDSEIVSLTIYHYGKFLQKNDHVSLEKCRGHFTNTLTYYFGVILLSTLLE